MESTVRTISLPNGRILKTRGLGYEESQEINTNPMHEIYSCNIISIHEIHEDSKEEELKKAPKGLEDGGQTTCDELIEINLGSEKEAKPTYISALLSEKEKEQLKLLLQDFNDCFAWSYKEMPGLDADVAIHKLAISSEHPPIKQAPRRMRIELEEQIIIEIKKLIDADFIREEKYADWIASVVPVKKKNGQIRICVDYRDLNNACPKDDFPLPISEVMIDSVSNFEIFSFMDGFFGYNQIKMAPEDERHISFRTPIGIYCYIVMPFGLKNAGATYQRAMTKIFDDLIHKIVECYVDDLVIKSQSKMEHW